MPGVGVRPPLELELEAVINCLMWYWELDSSPLGEQQMLLAAAIFQPQPYIFTPDTDLAPKVRSSS